MSEKPARDFIISTDSTADLPKDYVEKHNLAIHPLYYNLEGEVYGGDHDLEPKAFYDIMRNGKLPTTMATNPEDIISAFMKYLNEGYDILHISFSSALSSSYSNTVMVANEMSEQYPDALIMVLDSASASLGQGLLVHKALQMKESGSTLNEIAKWIEENKCHICHQFTVDDLFHLHRGGRVSKAAAVIGTLINVKPVLHVDNEGRLIPLQKVRGRKKALTTLVDNMEQQIKGFENNIIFISDGDCKEDAEFVKSLIEQRFGIKDFLMNYVSPTIGAHSGPGTIALFFMGKER